MWASQPRFEPQVSILLRAASIGPLYLAPPVCSRTLIVSNGYSRILQKKPESMPESKSRAPSLRTLPDSHKSDAAASSLAIALLTPLPGSTQHTAHLAVAPGWEGRLVKASVPSCAGSAIGAVSGVFVHRTIPGGDH